MIRWNALAMVVRANQTPLTRGHIGASSPPPPLRYRFGHFWRARRRNHGGDIIYIRASSPGIYARAFVEGR